MYFTTDIYPTPPPHQRVQTQITGISHISLVECRFAVRKLTKNNLEDCAYGCPVH